jgi:hypothetical protein
MPLKLVVDKIEDIDEPQRPLYVEKDGKFHLDVDGIEDTAPLKKSLESARRVERDIKKKIEAWEKLGKTPEEIAEMLAKLEDDVHQKAIKDGDWEAAKKQMLEKHDKEMDKLRQQLGLKDSEIVTLRSSIEKGMLEREATQAITAEKGKAVLLMPHVTKYAKVLVEDGRTEIQVVDDKGQPRFNGKGDPMTLLELVAEMRLSDTYGQAFEGTGSSGSGSPPQGGPNSPSPALSGITKKSDFPKESLEGAKARAAYIEKYGFAAYDRLPL